MASSTNDPGFLHRAYAWPRLRVMLVAVAVLGTLLSLPWTGARSVLFLRLVLLGLALLTVFAVTERWPRRLPRLVARWALQIVVVAITVPFATAVIYSITTLGDAKPWTQDELRMAGYSMITGFALLVSPWIVMVAVFRDISGRAQRQAMAFELERAQLEQQALGARLRLLQAQVEPHFLFNTLANIRELVEQRSPEAPAMLQRLIDYLRAAVPRLNQPASTVAEELELVRSYLDIMRMRMPDRLQYSVDVPPAALGVACPPAALLVLVENAVRHGIDPGEAGGAIAISAHTEPALASSARTGAGKDAPVPTCLLEVSDTGVGFGAASSGLGTGLENLRERLRLMFGPVATVELAPNAPRGTRAVLRLPMETRDDG